MAESFHISVITPKHTFFDQDARMLVVEAEDGQLGILPGHEPMVVSMIEGTLRIQL